jgi:hypothetical protein
MNENAKTGTGTAAASEDWAKRTQKKMNGCANNMAGCGCLMTLTGIGFLLLAGLLSIL